MGQSIYELLGETLQAHRAALLQERAEPEFDDQIDPEDCFHLSTHIERDYQVCNACGLATECPQWEPED